MAGSQDFSADPRNAAALIYLNGQLVSRDEARVSIFDGGFVVGDGVWEGLRLHRGALLFLEEHLDRLYWGAGQIRLEIGLDRAALTAVLWQLLEANRMRDGVHIRLMVTRVRKQHRIRIRATPSAAQPWPSSPSKSCPILSWRRSG